MTIETLPTLEEITKQLEEANKKRVPSANAEEEVLTPDPETPSEEPPGETADEVKEKKDPAEELAEAIAAKEPEKKEDPFSKRFAALTRADKLRRQKETELSQKMKALEDRQRQFEEREAAAIKVKSPLDALKHHGFRYDDATSQFLGMPQEKEVDPVDEKVRGALDPLGQKMSQVEQKLQELADKTSYFEQLQQQQSEREIRYAIQATASDGEYPYITGLGKEAFDNVYDFMVEYYQKHKQPLTYKQACDKVEGYYKRIAEVGGARHTDSGAKDHTKQVSQSDRKVEQPAKTLTQQHQAASRSKQNLDDLSPTEAKRRLATMLKFTR